MAGNSVQIVFEAVDKAAAETLKRMAKGLDGVTEAAKKTEKSTSVLGDVMDNLVGGMTAASLVTDAIRASLAFLKKQLQETIDAAMESEVTIARTAATLDSMGRSAEFSAEGLAKMAQEMSLGTMFDDEAILETMNSLLRFSSVTKENLPDITQLAMDMASALGTDAAGAANQLGGALETGIIPKSWKLDAATKANIQSLIAQGKESEALAVIMDKLGDKFEGQADAMGNTTKGAAEQAKNALENLKEEIGAGMLPSLEKLQLATKNAALGFAEFFKHANTVRELEGAQESLLNSVGLTTEYASRYNQDLGGMKTASEDVQAASFELARTLEFGGEWMRNNEIDAASLTEKIAELGVQIGLTPEQIQTQIDLIINGEDALGEFQEQLAAFSDQQKIDFVMSFQAQSDNFEETREELLSKMRDTRDKILAIREEMAAGTMRQSEGKSQIAELGGEMTDLTNQINDNEAAWKQWQKQTAFSLMSTQALAKGASFEEVMKMGEDFGVIDPEIVAQATAMMDAITDVDPGNLSDAVSNVRELIDADGRRIVLYVDQYTTTQASGTMPTTGAPSSTMSGVTNVYNFYDATLLLNREFTSDILAEWR